ncbi:MAG: DUF460 domain-containing protein [Candidatus Woesearchaeota archaeon]
MKKSLLIVGIDPGTTVGYTILDLNGKPIMIDSAKELDLDTIVAKITAVGIPLAVGCDKAKVPGFIDDFATKTGAKLFWPKEDMKVEEKREITKGFSCKNNHESDALASALLAFRKIEGLLRRIDKFLIGKNKIEHSDRLKELVVKKGINIAGAFEMLTQPEQKETKIIKQVIEEKRLEEKDFLKLYNELKKSEEDKKRLKQQNNRLLCELQKLEKLKISEKKEKKPAGILSDKKLKFKEDKIQFLDRIVKKQMLEIHGLKTEIAKFYSTLANINNKIVAKKLKNLGWNEFQQKKDMLGINKGDVLLVDDPNEFSEKTLAHLKSFVDIIIAKKEPGRKLEELGFVFIDSSRVQIEEDKYFAFINKGSFEEARRNKELLKNIIKSYQKQRAI